MNEYEFTVDWFSWNAPMWEQICKQLPSRKRFLEIGSFEGRSTVWLIENAIEDGGKIVCIDTWEGSEEHIPQGHNMGAVEERFHKNVTLARSKAQPKQIHCTSFRSTSLESLSAMIFSKEEQFDFIYIDGSHQAPDVITDACLCWPLLKLGGVLVFDDYQWGINLPPTHKPEMAVDAFVEIYKERIHLVQKSYQLTVQKLRD